MSCPKCNHFCCRKCFENFFQGQAIKKCPICKRDITFNELNKNTIIQEIENIINKVGNNAKKKKNYQNYSKQKKMNGKINQIS